jgi:hypothetical protein
MAGEPKNEAPFTNPVGSTTVQPSAPPSPQASGIMTVQSADQIANTATSEVNSDITGQTTPLQTHIDTLDTQEGRTRDAIGAMFGTIMPYVQGSADAVKTGYDEAQMAEANIFKQASIQLNQFKQSRAQEAQALAQEIGGPVALSEFTSGLGDSQQALANAGAGQLLHTLGYAQAGEQAAQAFAGTVMPLVQTQEQAKARNYFEDQKKDLQSQIDVLKASAPAKIEARKQELTAAERTFGLAKESADTEKARVGVDERTRKNNLLIANRTYQLQKAQQGLDRVKADHDWLATKRTLHNDDARLTLAQQQAQLTKAQLTGTVDGKKTVAQQQIDLQAKQLTQREKEYAQQLGMTKQEFALRKQQMQVNTKFAQQKVALAKQTAAAEYLDAAMTSTYGKTVTTTTPAEITQVQAMRDKGSWTVKGKDGKDHYYHMIKSQYTPQVTAPITNPNLLTDYLVAHNVPKPMAEKMVRARLNLPNWKYGQDPAQDAAKKAFKADMAKENARRANRKQPA